MGSNINEIGLNAGKIWKMLDLNGSLSQTQIVKKTKIKYDDFYTAIGWLACENKICSDGNIFWLGETNLKDKIGNDAGKIWNILYKCGDIDETYIPKLAEVDKYDTYSAIGWLAKEGKIKTKNVKPKKTKRFYGLK